MPINWILSIYLFFEKLLLTTGLWNCHLDEHLANGQTSQQTKKVMSSEIMGVDPRFLYSSGRAGARSRTHSNTVRLKELRHLTFIVNQPLVDTPEPRLCALFCQLWEWGAEEFII